MADFEVHIDLADAHVQFDATQLKAPEVQARLPRAEVHLQVQRRLVAKLHLPLIAGVADASVAGFRLGDDEIAVRAGFGVAHLRLPGRHVEREIGARQLLGAIGDAQIARAHVHFDVDRFGALGVDGFRIVLHGPGGVVHYAGGQEQRAGDREAGEEK